jgi:hypothetical protein
VGGPGGFEPGTSPKQPARDEPAARTTRLGGGYCLDRSSARFEVYTSTCVAHLAVVRHAQFNRSAPLRGAPRISYT